MLVHAREVWAALFTQRGIYAQQITKASEQSPITLYYGGYTSHLLFAAGAEMLLLITE